MALLSAVPLSPCRRADVSAGGNALALPGWFEECLFLSGNVYDTTVALRSVLIKFNSWKHA